MARKRGIRRANRNDRWRAERRPSTYIHPFEYIRPGDKVWLWCRVSSGIQDANGNNSDQEAELRAAVKACGATVVGIQYFVGRTSETDAALFLVAKRAANAGSVLLAESTSRFVRHPQYHPRRPDLRPGANELLNLNFVCGDVSLVTLHHPDSTWQVERSCQSKRGQRRKENQGGRPIKKKPGLKKQRRRVMLSKVYWHSKLGLSVREIAAKLGEHKTQIQRWRDKLRGR